VPEYERIVPVYHKTDVSGLQAFLQPVGWKWQLLGFRLASIPSTCGLEMAAAWRTYGKVIAI